MKFTIFADVDGVVREADKSVQPIAEDQEPYLETYRAIRAAVPQEAQLVLATGRSYASTRTIAEAVGSKMGLYEMGLHIVADGESYPLIDEDHPLHDAQEEVRRLREAVDRNMPSMRRTLSSTHGDIRFLSDRELMVCIETSGDINGVDVEALILEYGGDKLDRYRSQGSIRVVTTKDSVDVMPNITKGDALKYFCRRYGIDTGRTAGIGDSDHSDLYLLEAAQFAGAPSNAGSGIKAYIGDIDGRGYLSEHPVVDGLLDILDHAGRVWV